MKIWLILPVSILILILGLRGSWSDWRIAAAVAVTLTAGLLWQTRRVGRSSKLGVMGTLAFGVVVFGALTFLSRHTN